MKLVCLVMFMICGGLQAQPLFRSVPSSQSGIDFQNTIIETSTQNVLAYEYFYNGGGVATGDLNNDGLPDIVFTANIEQPQIYFNKGDFKFLNVSEKSKVKASGWKTGVALADVNADGWLDIYISRSGKGDDESRKNLLFINQKNGAFKEMAGKYGIDDMGYSTQAAFFDYDKDGDLDLYVLNHPVKRLTRFDVAYVKAARDPLAGDHLYRNDGGRFADVSADAGISGNPISFGLGVAVADFNEDGWPDLYISNDYDEDDYLYINLHNGTFKESASAFMGHTSKFSMGSDVGDINNDGIHDLLTLDMLPEDNERQKLLKGPDGYDHFEMLLRNGYSRQYMRNMLQLGVRNKSGISFSEIGQLAGISNTDWSWSALFGDYDLDGWQDLFITNGYMRDYTNMDFLKYSAPEAIRKAREAGHEPDLLDIVSQIPASQIKNYFFRNKGDLSFEKVSTVWGVDSTSLSNGAAYADFDNDGDLDLVVNNTNQPAFLYQNHAEDRKNNFLKLKFTGPAGNPFGIGVKVIVSAKDGFQQIQELQLSHGFQSSVEPALFFGLGKRQQAEIRIIWPDDKVETISKQAVNKTLVINHKNALALPKRDSIVTTNAIFKELSDNSDLFVHHEDDYNDFKREPLLPHQFSRYGPAIAAGDADGDSKVDFLAGGAKGQASQLYINKGDGKFITKPEPVLEALSEFEITGAVFADLDGDKDLDLYLVSGGNESNFADHLFWNDGRGNYFEIRNQLPETKSSGGAVTVIDIDHDGDLDIFRGGQVLTGSYPLAPESYLFLNTKGAFTDVTPAFLKHVGMVKTADTADLNGDGFTDLVLAGEYLPVTILYGMGSSPYFAEKQEKQIAGSSGWWNRVVIRDINKDGKADIIAGNDGLNSQMKPTVKEPLTIDAADLDNNGSVDCVISYYIDGKSYPMATRDELLDQVPSFKTKFATYQAYSHATAADIFTPDQLKSASHLKVEEFRSGVFINEGREFKFQPFLNQGQAFPVRGIIAGDFNKDGREDLLLTGNNYSVRAQSGRYDAGKGMLLVQQQDGSFIPLENSGFLTDKDARNMVQIGDLIIVANNNDKIQIFSIR